jgi:hypothetical protein
MPALKTDTGHSDLVVRLLHARGLTHLRVRVRGPLVTIESGPADDPIPHARFRHETALQWQLEIATHTGRWEATPFRDELEPLVAALADTFGWVLTPIG